MQLSRYWIRKMKNILLSFVLFLLGKGVKDVAIIYATLIIKGVKDFADVPIRIKDQVKQVLIDLDCGHLAGE